MCEFSVSFITFGLNDLRQEIEGYKDCGSVYLRVFSKIQKRPTFIYINEYCTKKDFDNIMSGNTTKSHLIDLDLKMQSIRKQAERFNDFSKAKTLNQFKDVWKNKNSITLLKHYYLEIQDNKLRDNTSQFYENSYKAILRFKGIEDDKNDNINVLDIDSKFIDDFKTFYTKEGKRINTISAYLRPLKAVIKYAINDPNCPMTKEDFPFKKGHIQTELVKRKILSSEELKKLQKYNPTSETKQRAYDWFWMSYYLGGVNMNDLLRIKKSDIENNSIYFYRKKTVDVATTVVKLKKAILPEIQETFEKYKGRGVYHFGRLNNKMDDKKIVSEIKNFSKLINKGLKKIAKEIDINEGISFGWARHSYSTNLLRKGNDKIKVSQSMGHTNPKTIENYWGGFEDEEMQKLQEMSRKI